MGTSKSPGARVEGSSMPERPQPRDLPRSPARSRRRPRGRRNVSAPTTGSSLPVWRMCRGGRSNLMRRLLVMAALPAGAASTQRKTRRVRSPVTQTFPPSWVAQVELKVVPTRRGHRGLRDAERTAPSRIQVRGAVVFTWDSGDGTEGTSWKRSSFDGTSAREGGHEPPRHQRDRGSRPGQRVRSLATDRGTSPTFSRTTCGSSRTTFPVLERSPPSASRRTRSSSTLR